MILGNRLTPIILGVISKITGLPEGGFFGVELLQNRLQ